MTKNSDLKIPIDTPLTTLFCLIDDFCTDISEQVEQYMLTCGKIKRVRQSQICASEVITLLLWFHLTGSRNFKALFAALTLYALVLVNGYKSGIQQILKPIELKSA